MILKGIMSRVIYLNDFIFFSCVFYSDLLDINPVMEILWAVLP